MIADKDLACFLEEYSLKIKQFKQAGYTSNKNNNIVNNKLGRQIMAESLTPEQQKENRDKAKRMQNNLIIRDLRKTSKSKDTKYAKQTKSPVILQTTKKPEQEAKVISLAEYRERRLNSKKD